MPTYTRPAPVELLGTASAPAGLDAGQSRASDPLDLGETGPYASGAIVAVLGRLLAFPDPSPAVRFQFSLDGVAWYTDRVDLPVIPTDSPASCTWEGPPEARSLRAVVDNGTGVPISARVVGERLAVT